MAKAARVILLPELVCKARPVARDPLRLAREAQEPPPAAATAAPVARDKLLLDRLHEIRVAGRQLVESVATTGAGGVVVGPAQFLALSSALAAFDHEDERTRAARGGRHDEARRPGHGRRDR